MSESADPNNIFLEIHAGAGGTESQDWAEMLTRMYIRWAEKKEAKVLLLQETRGEEAGIKSTTIKIEKDFPLSRNELFVKLHKSGIGTSVQYYPLHLMSYNKKQYRNNDFPVANKLKDQVLSLPIFPTMSRKQIEFVVKNLT